MSSRQPNEVTGANEGGLVRLPARMRLAARIVQFWPSVKHDVR
jgi:hypothetical protein